MAHVPTPIRYLAALGMLFALLGSGSEISADAPRTAEQQTLVDFGLSRFEAQGLELPNVKFVFYDSLVPCQGRKGRYWAKSQRLEMCSVDKSTMLHELAHAWANLNMTIDEMNEFVARRGLGSWNDRDDAWERRGTEHVAETIAWALLDDPKHVKWVEAQPDGSKTTEYRILTLGVEVEVLLGNFKTITGQDPILRNAAEWSISDETPNRSPELARLGL